MCDSVNATSNFVSKYYSQSERVVGRVKWFNSKTGFGFISVLGDESKDIFVHHSELQVQDEQYRYLTQGEYVEFVVGTPEESSKYDVVAKSVTGLMKGMLMCETRRIMRMSRPDEEEGFEAVKMKKTIRGGGPRQLRPSSPAHSPPSRVSKGRVM